MGILDTLSFIIMTLHFTYRVVLLLKGDSVEGGNSDEMFAKIITENPNELDHEVAAVTSGMCSFSGYN